MDATPMAQRIFTGRATAVARSKADDGTPIIVKQLLGPHPSPEAIARLRREFETMRMAAGEGVVAGIELTEVDGLPAILEEDIGGESVARHIAEGGPLQLLDALEVGVAVARALQRVHRAGIIHKDVNPANVVWNRETGQVQLIDFGISSRLSRESPALASPARLEGTLAYIAPEQTGRMNRPIDTRADLYSLGVTLYELLAGQRPFDMHDALEFVHAHVALTPRPLHQAAPEVPLVLSDLVARLMEKAAEDRYQSAGGCAEDLARCLESVRSGGSVERFELATRDVRQRLQVPGRLYGRDAEQAALGKAFAQARGGDLEVVLVSGYSGIGKTSLIHELVRPVVQARGVFVAGKFEQFNRGRPYASLLQAFGGFVRQLLSEPEAHMARWRERLLAGLSGDGVVLTEVLPELALVIGEQPPVVDLPPTESATRFQIVFRRFVRSLAGPDHPLVLFFDDLQWADLPTLTLLESLATDDEAGFLLVIGAYRDNEVGAGHPLTLTLKRIQQTGRRLRTLKLRPLGRATVGEIVADSVGMSPHDTADLAELVFAKTRGNPFFQTAFIEALYRDELVVFDVDAGTWTWDADEIRRRQVTDNVVDFMARRMRRLSEETASALSCAAFMGTDFDLDAVAAVLGRAPSDVADQLEEALEEELVSATDQFAGTYRFVHDRVQQAAYSLSSEDERAALHLAFGRILLQRLDGGGDASLFDVVNAMNAGASVITDAAERARLRALNLQAGRLGLGAAAYAPAYGYLRVGLELLDADAWDRDDTYEQTLELHLETASAAYLSHHREAMTELVGVVLERGRTEFDKVRAYEVEIYASFAAGELGPTLDRGLAVLRVLGVDLPAEPTQDDVVAGLMATQAVLDGKDGDAIYGLPVATADRTLAVARILNTLTSPSYFARPSLLPLLAFQLVQNAVRDGLAPESQYGFAVYGLILCSIGDVRGGIGAGEIATRLGDRVDHARLRNLTRHIYLAHICFWYNHWRELRGPEREVYRVGHDQGDLLFACFGSQMAGTAGLFGQDELGPLLADMRESEQAISRLGQAIPLMLQNLNLELTVALHEGPEHGPDVYAGEYFDEREMVPQLAEAGDASNLYVFSTLKTLQCLILGTPEAAAEAAEFNQAWLAGAASSLYAPMYTWGDAMAQLGAFHLLPEERREAVRERVAAQRAQLASWAEIGPMNLAHRLALVDAEWARVFGGETSAHQLYPKAIAAAAAEGWVGDQALGNELAGRLALSDGNATVARAYLSEARHLYERWGALAKVRAMDARYERLLERAGVAAGPATRRSGTVTATATGTVEVDSLAVVRASRAISQEIKLSALVETLLRISLETSGARKGVLVIVDGESLVAYAEGKAETELTVHRVDAALVPEGATAEVDADGYAGCSAGILRYVQRTHEPVVLEDAAAAGTFVSDPYVQAHGVRSVLAVPLEQQGRLVAMLYLENAETASVFTVARVELMQTIGAQAAISIENATLYASLEEKVEERTRELAEARKQSDELLRNILPESIAAELKETGHAEPVAFESTSVMFTDFVGFTRIAETMSAPRLVAQLDDAFSAFDAIIDRCGLEKLKTIGDAYMCAGGVPTPTTTHAADCILAGLAFQDYMLELQAERRAAGEAIWELRIGVHTGPLVAGVIGNRKFAYDVWGDTVNVASRMETHGIAGRVNVSEATWRATAPLFVWTDRGEVQVKNKGAIHMYVAESILPELSIDGLGRRPNTGFADALMALLQVGAD